MNPMLKPRRMKKRVLSLLVVTLVGCLASCRLSEQASRSPSEVARTQEVRVVTSGGFAAAYDVLAPDFEKETGLKLTRAYGSSSGGALDSIPKRLERGEDFDVIILSQSSLNSLTERGYVRKDSRTDLVRSSIGMAVREGAEVPDISTVELFHKALFDAESIGYSASASGTYLSTVLFPRLGLWEALKPKSQRILSERVAAVVARGDVEIGFQQISEILPIPGAQYVGPIPDEYQRVTTFSIGITASARNAAGAKRLVDYLSSTRVAPTIAQTGLEPVATE